MEKIGRRDHHGIALPLFSLRNPQSSGIGEFLDLIPMIKWCHEVGFSVIQLLPMNDSGSDSSPYSALTAMALHPIYLSLNALPLLDLVPEHEAKLTALSLSNSEERFSYPLVRESKDAFLREYFTYVFPQLQVLPDYQAFTQNEHWLHDYALFKSLKDKNEQKSWWEWDERLTAEEADLNFYKMAQYLAFSQWEKVKEAAEEHGIFLKGDIPILINRDSASSWSHRDLFDFNFAAGAPPDMYSEDGQYWGFPIYDWKKNEATGFSWWKERLRVAEKLYHLYRLDHVVGFFRIWAIPLNKKAKEGYFIPQNESEWIPLGEKILRMLLSSSSMLPIGEDLGTVPPEVRLKLRELGIPGTKVNSP